MDLCKLLFLLYTSKHKDIQLPFYAYNTQVYVHLSLKNTSTAFEQLNRCLDDVKEWMSTSKLKWNPNKTLRPAESVKNLRI